MDRQEASERTRTRLKREEQEIVERRKLEKARRDSKSLASRTGIPTRTEPPRPAPDPITATEFEVCHITTVLRRRTGPGKYTWFRVSVQVGCGTHMGDVKVNYEPLVHPSARDLPQRGEAFGRDLARILALELNSRCTRG